MEVNYMSKILNKKSKNPGRFVEETDSRVFTLPVAYFARIIDFRSRQQEPLHTIS